MPAQPSIMVPMASAMASASGWPLMSILMAPVVTWIMFPFFYQAPPVVLAVALGELKIWWVIRMLLVYMIMSVILTITATIGSDKNILESLPDISSEESSTLSSEPSIPENN